MSIAAVVFAVALQAPTAPPAPVAPGLQDPKEIFSKAKCVLCHGEEGRGDTEKGKKLKAPDFTSSKWFDETTDKEILDTIQKGVKNKKGEVLMPSFKSKLTPEQIKALAGYVRTFHKK
ncbi:MAG TPA: c-type cytochrome [Myxococcales bacterium]|nr:c-type cytochrome [Myxococcales bacterium]